MLERKDYTPTKSSKHLPQQSTSYTRPILERSELSGRSSEIQYLKDYQSTKMQARQLEQMNRQLSTELEKLRYEKNLSENKYQQKLNFEEESIAQFQKQKNYQAQMIKIKHEQQVNRIRREFEGKIDELVRDIKNKDYSLREVSEQKAYVEMKNNQFKKQLDCMDLEIIKSRQTNSIITEKLTKEEFHRKKLEMLADELDGQKNQMEAEIHVLLDIEAEKSRAINSLETQLRNSEMAEKGLQQKLTALTDNFTNLEQHISIMKQRLLSSDVNNEELERVNHSLELALQDKENLVLEQKDREVRLRGELEQHQKREMLREREVNELMGQNQRLYRQLNVTRHKMHDICVSHGIDT